MEDVTGSDLVLSKGAIKNLGHEVNGRISGDAAIYVAVEEQERIIDVWITAKELANHAGRETIREEDVRLAYKVMER